MLSVIYLIHSAVSSNRILVCPIRQNLLCLASLHPLEKRSTLRDVWSIRVLDRKTPHMLRLYVCSDSASEHTQIRHCKVAFLTKGYCTTAEQNFVCLGHYRLLLNETAGYWNLTDNNNYPMESQMAISKCCCPDEETDFPVSLPSNYFSILLQMTGLRVRSPVTCVFCRTDRFCQKRR